MLSGRSHRSDDLRLLFGVSPAHAGMDPRWRCLTAAAFLPPFPPHTRGWTAFCPRVTTFPPHTRGWTVTSDDFPPHTRGWTLESRLIGNQWSVSPAHAGMDPSRATSARRSRCFPRTRGDGPDTRTSLSSSPEFPPHTRGWTRTYHGQVQATAVSPAHAGMDPHSYRGGP